MIKKGMLIVSVICMMFLFCACSFKQTAYTEDTIVINKKGVVTGVIVEPFDKEYYDADELEQMMKNEISAYNQGGDAVSLEKFEVTEEKKASVQIQYATAADYKAFNEKELFAGTVKEAYEQGYEFADMHSVTDATVTLQAKDVLEKGSMHIVIFEEPVAVSVNGKIAYVSDKVTVTDKKEAKAETAEDADAQLFYIIYE